MLCVLSATTLQVYPGGVATSTPLLLSFDAATLRERLTERLGIEGAIVYDVPGHGRLEWKKQPWSLFTAKGVELQVGMEAKTLAKQFAKASRKPAVLLLFEGGAWRWPTMAKGYRRRVMPGVFLTTVSRQPALFEVHVEEGDVDKGSVPELGLDLLANVVNLAEKRLEPSNTEGKVDKRMRSSDQTFLPYNSDPLLRKLSAGTAKLLRGHEDTLEHLQVLRYAENQHYDAHRDYWDPREFPDVPRFRNQEGFWHMRHATLLWYLAAPEAGGETWFPRANGGPIPYNEWMACDSRGAKVSPANATAVLFYSLRADGNIDEYSWHCGCPVKAGVKWAANSWMGNTPRLIRPKARQAVPTSTSSEL